MDPTPPIEPTPADAAVPTAPASHHSDNTPPDAASFQAASGPGTGPGSARTSTEPTVSDVLPIAIAPVSVPAPAPTPVPAPAVAPPQPSDPRDDPALQALAQRTLEAAELATRCAEDAARHGQTLQATSAQLKSMLATLPGQQRKMLWTAGGVSLASLVVAGAMAMTVETRIARLDATTLAVGKRAVEMNGGLKELAEVQKLLAEMQDRQAEIVSSQTKLDQRLEAALSLAQQLPSQKDADSATAAAQNHAKELERRLATQSASLNAVNAQLRALQKDLAPVQGLQREVSKLLETPRAKPPEAGKPAAAPTVAAAPAFKGPVYPRVPPAEAGASASR